MIIEKIDPSFEPKIHIKDDFLDIDEEPEIIVIDLAERDKKIDFLNKILTQRKNQMINNYQSCKTCYSNNLDCNTNANIDSVISNYKNYFENQIINKEKQLQNIKNLDDNLNELLNNKILSDENINNIKKDQEQVSMKMKKIDDELKQLIEVIKN